MSEKPLDANGKPYNRTLLTVTMIVGVFMAVLSSTMLATAYPALMKAFDVSTSTVQWLTTGYLLVNGVMIPITAWLMNRFSSKLLYNLAMIFFLGGTILAYCAPNFGTLFVARLIQAVGAGISMPLGQALLLSIFPPDKRGATMGIFGLAIGLAPAIGPTLSGWIIDNYNWRVLFGILIPIGILVVVLGLIFFKKLLPTNNDRLDILSAGLSTIGFGSLLYGFSEVGDKGWGSSIVITFIIIGIIFIGLFAWRQLTMKDPFLNLNVFRNGEFTLTTILAAVVNMAMVGVEMIVPLYLQTVRGDTAFESGLTLLPGALMIGIASPITGRIFDKMGAKRLATAGMILLTIGTIPFLFLTKDTPVAFIVIVYAIRMVGVGMVMMPVTTAGMNVLPVNQIGHGTAVNSTLRQVASSVGTAILVSVLTNVTNNNMPAKHVLHQNPLQYKDLAINSVLNGYTASFGVAILFCLIGWALTYFLKQNNPTKGGVK